VIAPNKPWFIYTRVSTDEQAREGTSLQTQRASCEAYAVALGLPVSAVVEDPGESGKDLHRPGIERVIAAMRAGAVAGVIIYKLDRLTRSRRDLEDILILLQESGTNMVSVNDRLDTSSANGRMFVALLGVIAAWERETIVERVTTGIRHRKSQGGFVGGPVPAGLVVEGEKGKRVLKPDPRWGPVVAKVWPRLAEQGASLTQVAGDMNAAKLPGSARKWSSASVRKLALNPRYVGLLVTAELQERARAALAERFSPWKGTGTSIAATTHALRPWPLSGIGRCGSCGAPLKGNTVQNHSGKPYHYYQCTVKVRTGGKGCAAKDLRAEPWEAGVVAILVRSIQENGKLAPSLVSLQRDCAKRVGPLNEEMKALGLERDKLLAELRNLAEMVAAGGLTAQALGPALNARQASLNAVQLKMARAEGELAAAGMTEDQARDLLEQVQGQIAALPEAEPEDQARAVRTMVAQATLKQVSKQQGEIDLVVNLPRQAAGKFGRGHPVVEDRTVRPNTVRWTDTVELRYPQLRSAAAG
jgi:site-specific DNA recombinase